ncbi:translation initiation factor eIF-2B subunit delta-like [Cylas formicarius]|uniref:translation initiation factor eIF-2B subunit delta-like n=1 Tax=Cylas formicarius TaxID=197179 RepID=UPI002958AA86|nr:translation initiation factor eIF-2B subunit delta-like isoform X2 [Cylas formicarius]XP_060531520.1 translation initiation factor eIF-2B subunit delta-like [Cylas formicarius]
MEKKEVAANRDKKPEKVKSDKIQTTVSEQNSNKENEKLKRKLEWEKRLAEQKLKGKTEETQDLSKTKLKAIRRERQEAQRQAKAEYKVQEKPKSKREKTDLQVQHTNTVTEKPLEVKKSKAKYIQFVQHLYRQSSPEYSKFVNYKDVHAVFVHLGIQYAEKVILGSNARCLALLSAMKYLINDLQTPPKQEFGRYLESVLQHSTNYLQNCRPLSVSMTNVLRHFKLQLTRMDANLTDNAKKAHLQEVIDLYINNDIKKAWDAISMKVNQKIVDGDVILIFGCSSLIRKILFEAHKDEKKFSVIIVDSRPLLEGREMLRRLVSFGIKCTYIFINAISYIMTGVTKVLLAAHALLTNGYVMSRVGTAQVALVAQAYNKPVLVCCETYKFSEMVQTHAFIYNEIDSSTSLFKAGTQALESPLAALKDNPKLNVLNLLYDVTPPDLVTAVVTELAILPCTSVPVVLRINASETIL